MPRLILRQIPAALAGALSLLPASAHADAAAGKQKAQMCVVCHGLDGIGKTPDAPNLAGESKIYLTKQLVAYRSGERTHEQMSLVAQSLSDEDISNLADWYSSLKITVEMPE